MEEKKNIEEALLHCPLFKGIKADAAKDMVLSAGAKIITLEKNSIYTFSGMPMRFADIVISGVLLCRMSTMRGRMVQITKLRQGNMVSPVLLFGKDNHFPVSIEAASGVQLLRMSPDRFKVLLLADSRLTLNFIYLVSNVGIWLTKELRGLTLTTIREKVVNYLLEKSQEQQSDNIILSQSQQEIADTFGIQKYSLQRVFAEMRELGIISMKGREIFLSKSLLKDYVPHGANSN